MKHYFESRGATGIYGSRDATREAFSKGLIERGDEWIAMIAARNRSSHTYNERTTNGIAAAMLGSFVSLFAEPLATLTELAKSEP